MPEATATLLNVKSLNFQCPSCATTISFSIFELDHQSPLCCAQCHKHYLFSDPTLIRQLKKFEALCRQIRESEEILGSTSVGVDVGVHHVKVPYKLLLTRLNSSLQLNMDGHSVAINFRIEPIKEAPCCSNPPEKKG